MKKTRLVCLCSLAGLLAGPALAQTATVPCSAATLNGKYTLTLTGRTLSSGAAAAVFDGLGTATFDGASKVTFTGNYDSAAANFQAFTYSGTYTLPSSCFGTITFTSGLQASFVITAWSGGQQFDLSGAQTAPGTTPVLVFGGSGTNVGPVACATASVSGPYTYYAVGSSIVGSAISDAANEGGTLYFDGEGDVTANYTNTSSQSGASSGSGTGAYTVTSTCTGSATVKDSVTGAMRIFNFSINGQHGENQRLNEYTTGASTGFIGSGAAHNAFDNPSQSIANVANYAYSATPAGSVFALFGVNIASKPTLAQTLPLPPKLDNVSVTVNGETAPLFYVDSQQIDAQMPWDIAGNTVASVVVTSGAATSNAAAVYVPATGTPGLSFISGTNRAVVVNVNNTVNAANNPAAVGDEEVLYFTGGGPVNAAGKLVSGAVSPNGLSPVTDPNPSITVGGTAASVVYVGLTPGSVGLYQANFYVPQLPKGTYPVVLTISGTASNTLLGEQDPNPVMTISN